MDRDFIESPCQHGRSDSHAYSCGSCPCWHIDRGSAGDCRTPLRAGGERVTHVVAKNDEATLVPRVAPDRRALQLGDLPSERPFGRERPPSQTPSQRPCRLDVDGEPEHDRWDLADLCRVWHDGNRQDLVSDRLMSRFLPR